jgi:hypothetical protein
MLDLEERYIKLMKSNRDLRMELFLYITELLKEDKELNSKEVAEKLIAVMNN